jgi:hypothetical protein
MPEDYRPKSAVFAKFKPRGTQNMHGQRMACMEKGITQRWSASVIVAPRSVEPIALEGDEMGESVVKTSISDAT